MNKAEEAYGSACDQSSKRTAWKGGNPVWKKQTNSESQATSALPVPLYKNPHNKQLQFNEILRF